MIGKKTLVFMRLAAACCGFALAACAPVTVRPQFLQPGFEVSEIGKHGAAVAVVADAILLDGEARRAFNSVYRTYDSLSRSIARIVVEELGASSSGLTMNRQMAASLAALNDSLQASRNEEFLRSSGARYLVHIREIQITREVRSGDPPSVALVALFKVDVWDAESGRILVVFEMDASDTVVWGGFDISLKSAVTDASHKVGLYLATGSLKPRPEHKQDSGSSRTPGSSGTYRYQ